MELIPVAPQPQIPTSPDMPPNAVTDMPNLLEGMTKDEMTKLGSLVVDDFEADIASRAEWEKRMGVALKLFAGVRDPKDFPWENAANVHIPLTGVACFQFQARAYEALITKEICRCFNTDGQSKLAAERCTKYMNWQLSYQMEEWEEEMDHLLLRLPIYGVAVKKTYWDAGLNRPSSRLLGIDEFVAPYGTKRLQDAHRKTHMFTVSLNNIRKAIAGGRFINTEDVAKEGTDTTVTGDIRESADAITGTTPSDRDEDKGRLFLEQHRYYDINGDGIGEPVVVWVDKDTRMPHRMESREYTNPVTGMQEVAEYFTDYVFFPNPESWMGIGLGHLLQGLNEAANTLINQIIDSGTLANLSGKTGFISKQLGLKKGKIELQLGKWTEVDTTAEDLKKAIYPLTFNDASPTLFNLLGLLDKYSKEISSLSESLLGKLPPSDTTATSMMTVMEQGLKVFSTIHKRVHRSLKKELQKIFYLNSLYLDENVYFMVQDSQSPAMEGYMSGRSDFINNIDVIPASDPNITSRAEKLVRAQQAYQAMMGNPLFQENPIAMYELTKDYLESMEIANIERFRLEEVAQMMTQFKLQQFQMNMAGMNGQPGNQPGRLESVGNQPGNQGVSTPSGNPQG